MSEDTDTVASMTYLGPPGSGLGFQLAGMSVVYCDSSDQLLAELKQAVAKQAQALLFVDEGLAVEVMDEVERLNADTFPAIVLLANPHRPVRAAARRLEQLMVTAVGSDIFSESVNK